MPDAPRNVLIWRNQLLQPSETFVANQARYLSRWHPRFAAYEAVANDYGVTPEVLASSRRDRALHALLKECAVAHAHFGPDASELAVAAFRARTPLVATFHGYDAAQRDVYPGFKAQARLRLLFATAKSIIAVSGYIADRLIDLGAPARKIVRHHIGTPIPPDEQDTEERQGILFVGRLVDKKGTDDLLAAVAELPGDSRRTPVTVIGDGPLRKSLQGQASDLGLNATFVGALSNDAVRSAMRRAAVLCAPSRRAANGDAEGLPITLLEALAHRLPVLSTTSSGIPEAITTGSTGVLVAERDRPAMTSALASLLNDETLRKQLAEAGRRDVEARFDIATQTAALETIYDSAARARFR